MLNRLSNDSSDTFQMIAQFCIEKVTKITIQKIICKLECRDFCFLLILQQLKLKRSGWEFLFFSIWLFFYEHSRFTGQQGKGEGIYLTRLYHFHPLHRHLDISWAITAESSPLHIAGSRTRTGNLWFPSANR